MSNGTEGRSDYLAPRFSVEQYDWRVFCGPRAGDPAPDFRFMNMGGDEVRLSDFHGEWVVIETGSATCSMYVKNLDGMRQLREEFPDVTFLLVYVREAHPGERLRQHRSFAEKCAAARLLPRKYGEDRPILIDTLEGDFHRAYGMMPNLLYVISPDGRVHYRCNWTMVDEVRRALSERDRPHTHENAEMDKLHAGRSVWQSVKVMWTGGFLALWDFIRSLPKMVRLHKMVDAYYKRHGRFINDPESARDE